jgi:hypothetical protein
MATFFIGWPAFDQIHFAEHRMAGTDFLIEASSIESESLVYRLFALR